MGDNPVPKAIGRRQVVVPLSSGDDSVIVERWSLGKMLYMYELFAKTLKELPNEELAKLKGGSSELVQSAAKLLGDRLVMFLRLSVREQDESKVTEDLPAEDALDVLSAVIELNLTEKFVKKVRELVGKTASLFKPTTK